MKLLVRMLIAGPRMPKMNGLEFHAKVRDKPQYRNTPFIFLTGVNDLTEVKAASKGDCDMLLQKPFPIDSLIRLFAGKFKV